MSSNNLITKRITEYRNKCFSKPLSKYWPCAEYFIYCWKDVPPVLGHCTLFVKLDNSYLRVNTFSILGAVFIKGAKPLDKATYETWLSKNHFSAGALVATGE